MSRRETPDEAWLSRPFEESYALLYRVGRVFLGASASQADIIEDEIQETFVLAWERRHKLVRHPNPAGRLVETFRRRLMAKCRRLGREGRRRAYSLDEEGRPDTADGQAPAV